MIADGEVFRSRRTPLLHREQRVQPRAVAQREDRCRDLIHGVAPHQVVADDAVHRSATRVEQPHVIVDLGRSRDGGARIARRVLLLDGNGRSEPVDQIDIRLLNAFQELPRVGGE